MKWRRRIETKILCVLMIFVFCFTEFTWLSKTDFAILVLSNSPFFPTPQVKYQPKDEPLLILDGIWRKVNELLIPQVKAAEANDVKKKLLGKDLPFYSASFSPVASNVIWKTPQDVIEETTVSNSSKDDMVNNNEKGGVQESKDSLQEKNRGMKEMSLSLEKIIGGLVVEKIFSPFNVKEEDEEEEGYLPSLEGEKDLEDKSNKEVKGKEEVNIERVRGEDLLIRKGEMVKEVNVREVLDSMTENVIENIRESKIDSIFASLFSSNYYSSLVNFNNGGISFYQGKGVVDSRNNKEYFILNLEDKKYVFMESEGVKYTQQYIKENYNHGPPSLGDSFVEEDNSQNVRSNNSKGEEKKEVKEEKEKDNFSVFPYQEVDFSLDKKSNVEGEVFLISSVLEENLLGGNSLLSSRINLVDAIYSFSQEKGKVFVVSSSGNEDNSNIVGITTSKNEREGATKEGNVSLVESEIKGILPLDTIAPPPKEKKVEEEKFPSLLSYLIFNPLLILRKFQKETKDDVEKLIGMIYLCNFGELGTNGYLSSIFNVTLPAYEGYRFQRYAANSYNCAVFSLSKLLPNVILLSGVDFLEVFLEDGKVSLEDGKGFLVVLQEVEAGFHPGELQGILHPRIG
ncbi:MAG: hypothetical protein B6D56_07410 [Candidatus Omnitrophica bacterium 4484_70.1]|nr:MAG: hypothetical protein B6D56_07410 [Candidatus Omnitrophica bacterium 4484_70.1]